MNASQDSVSAAPELVLVPSDTCVECSGPRIDPRQGRGYRYLCIGCYNRKRYHRNPHLQRLRMLKHLYHMTSEQYLELLAAQGGGCGACGHTLENPFDFHVDHDHRCCPTKKSCGKCVRGLLCDTCNRGLGYFKDDPQRLRQAADYLDRVIA